MLVLKLLLALLVGGAVGIRWIKRGLPVADAEIAAGITFVGVFLLLIV